MGTLLNIAFVVISIAVFLYDALVNHNTGSAVALGMIAPGFTATLVFDLVDKAIDPRHKPDVNFSRKTHFVFALALAYVAFALWPRLMLLFAGHPGLELTRWFLNAFPGAAAYTTYIIIGIWAAISTLIGYYFENGLDVLIKRLQRIRQS